MGMAIQSDCEEGIDTMRNIYILLLLLCSLAASSQSDYIELNSGTRYNSIIRVTNHEKQIRITDFRGKVYPIDHEFVARVHLGDSIRGLSGWTVYNSKYSNAADIKDNEKLQPPIDLHTEMAELDKSRNYLRAAGGWGIAGTALVLGGIITAAVSFPTGSPGLAYAGAAISGGGLILYIPAFANLMKAGKR